MRQEASSDALARGGSIPGETRSFPASHAQHFLPADGSGLSPHAACNDRPFLHGRMADDGAGFPADHCVVLVDFGFLCDRAAGTAPEKLEAYVLLPADADGRGSRAN